MHIVANISKCQGHGRCAILAPDVFDVDDEGKVVLLTATVPETAIDDADEAITSCPESALRRA